MVMHIHQIRSELKERLSAKRYRHTEGVAASSRELAARYGASPEKAELAGWVHDCAKEMTLDEMKALVREGGLAVDAPVLKSRALLHGPAGSVYARLHFGIDDAEILSAVFYHTTGKPDMSLLEKIVFLADYIEPSRDFPGVEELRALAEQDLDRALIAAYDSTIRHLAEQHAYIYDLTIAGRNYLILSQRHAQAE